MWSVALVVKMEKIETISVSINKNIKNPDIEWDIMEQVNLMNYSQMYKDKSVSNVLWTKKKK